MKNKTSSKLKSITSFVLMILMMVSVNASLFTPKANAEGETLTIGSQSADFGDSIDVPIIVSSAIADTGSMTLYINIDSEVLDYQGYTLDQMSVSGTAYATEETSVDQVAILWFYFAGSTDFNEGDVLLTLNFNVISNDTTTTNLNFDSSCLVADAVAETIPTVFENGTIILNSTVEDTTPPAIAETSPVSTPTNDSTPDYIFSSTEAGTIAYGGSCSSSTTAAVSGSNPITFDYLGEGTYSDCTITVTDTSFNVSNTINVTTFTIDTTPPVITIGTYATTPTNEDITVTASTNEGTLNTSSYIFTANGSFDFIATDDAGNSTTETVTVNNIDKTVPTATVSYDITVPTNGNVVATMIPSEAVTVTNNSGNSEYTFTTNDTFTFEFTDAAGNTGSAVATVNNINTIAPTATVSYDITVPTNGNVVATMIPSEAVTVTNNGGSLTYTFTENNSFIFEFDDEAGNEGSVTATVNNIDKVSPIITINSYTTTPTNEDITVTASTNEGTLNASSYIFTENGFFNFIATDDAGNSTTETVTVNNIDKTAPTATVSYDITVPTVTNVIVTMTPSEAVIVTNNGGSAAYTFTENDTFTFEFTDAAGNTGSAVATVNNIDTTLPVITLLGISPVTVEVDSTYIDAGATASDSYDGDITENITVGGDTVETATVGTYLITYDVSDAAGNPAVQVTRTVNVSDSASPAIIETSPVSTPANDSTPDYIFSSTEAGTIAYGGSCSSSTTAAVSGSNPITFDYLGEGTYSDCTITITDTSSNVSNIINVTSFTIDNTAPVIILLGDATVDLDINSVYTDAGATASDNTDGNITGNITAVSLVDISIAGTYTVTYNISDAAGNDAAQVTRTVNVIDVVDDIAPADIEDLTVASPTENSITLNWTAPGDNGDEGTAASYDIRYSTEDINDENRWDNATQVAGEPSPQIAGSAETITISGLNSGTTYYFAMKTSDEVPNESGMSNITSIVTNTSSSGGGGSSTLSNVSSFNESLKILSGQEGILNQKLNEENEVKVEIPRGSVKSTTTFTASEGSLEENDVPKNKIGAFLFSGLVFNIEAVDSNNNPVREFSEDLTITLTVPDLPDDTSSLELYYFDDESGEWIMITDVEFGDGAITFKVNHLTLFAVFETETPEDEETTPEIIDGDIIQCQSSNDPFAVYVVKTVGEIKYIRHIVSLEIFNHYEHLKWENLKQVDSLDDYSLSGWVRVNTGPDGTPAATDKVYEINGDQTRHWINMTAEQFLRHGGSDMAIYTVNQKELDLYVTGADVMIM